jgi:two-component system sensor histidine kinase DesK
VCAAPRPSRFTAISAYITSTHVALVVAAIAAPIIAIIGNPVTPDIATGIAMVGIIGVAGTGTLVSGRLPDSRLAKWWRRPGMIVLWSTLLVLASIALTTVSAPGQRDIAAVAFPLALAFRAVATGPFWGASIRVIASALICYLAARLLHGLAALDPGGLLTTVAFAGVIAFAVIGQDTVYALVLEIDDLRTTEAQRAVTQERQRFAGDLHDIQGQHLQLLAAEAQLVQRLLAAERYDEARNHAARLGRVANDAVEDMRSVVHGYRHVGVEEEAANAVLVLEAAGITVNAAITPLAGLTDDADRLLGLTIREGITNVLRHTHTRQCQLAVGKAHQGAQPGNAILLSDAGPSTSHTTRQGSGLAALQQRYTEAGGTLTFTQDATAGSQLRGWLPATPESRP